MTQPASVVNDGNHLLLLVPALFDPANPQLDELENPAVVDATCYLTATGWTPSMTEDRVPDNRLCTTQNYSKRGRLTFNPAFTYVTNPESVADDEVAQFLEPGTEFYAVWRPLVSYEQALAVGDKVTVYPLEAGEREFVDATENSVGQIMQQLHLRPPGRKFLVSVVAS